ncbi:Protein CBG26772 [Caenorhabditis briggsae]|uniref:Protein CBG26772 n=1 Tax=Caenorhabditis briggsae TaxID=6238 RepID=H8WH46_CAEBR|nr:Protein CBG26772 [Caenorhabditis briggsae]CCG58651.1 Protein CBG26772 [Caenorhabditis briggsae]
MSEIVRTESTTISQPPISQLTVSQP